MRLDHVNVVVPPGATEDAVLFYVALGLVRVPKPGRPEGAWFALPDGTQVHVSERAGAPHPDAHFALVVDDLDDLRARLEGQGRPWHDLPGLVGGRRALTADPAGNAVELLEAPAPAHVEPEAVQR